MQEKFEVHLYRRRPAESGARSFPTSGRRQEVIVKAKGWLRAHCDDKSIAESERPHHAVVWALPSGETVAVLRATMTDIEQVQPDDRDWPQDVVATFLENEEKS